MNNKQKAMRGRSSRVGWVEQVALRHTQAKPNLLRQKFGGQKIASSFLFAMTGAKDWLVGKGWKWVVLFGIYWWLVFSFYLTSPPPWPDEALFADIAATWRETGYWGTDLWRGMVPGIEQYYLQNPPGWFWLIAQVQRWYGVSIVWQRMLPVVVGSWTLIGLWLVGRDWLVGKGKWKWWWSMAMVSDWVFLYASRLSRPEILVLGCMVWSFWLLQKAKKKGGWNWGRVKLAGLVYGGAMLVHPIAWGFWVIGLVVVWWWGRANRFKILSWWIVTSLGPLAIWLGMQGSVWRLLVLQLHLATVTKNTFGYWWILARMATDSWLWISFWLLQLGWLGVGLWLWRNNKENWGLWLGVSGVWLIVMVGQMLWYVVYPIVWTYILLAWWVGKGSKLAKWIVGGVLVVNGGHLWVEWMRLVEARPNYKEFGEAVLEVVPEKAGVLLSVEPDPYFVFVGVGRQNQLYEFPAIILDPDQYGQMLDRVEYVVFDQEKSGNLTGNYLEMYLETNHKGVVQIHEGGYRTKVYKLKPVEERKRVDVPGGRFGRLPLQSEIVEKYGIKED